MSNDGTYSSCRSAADGSSESGNGSGQHGLPRTERCVNPGNLDCNAFIILWSTRILLWPVEIPMTSSNWSTRARQHKRMAEVVAKLPTLSKPLMAVSPPSGTRGAIGVAPPIARDLLNVD